jgi:hypothetical protein
METQPNDHLKIKILQHGQLSMCFETKLHHHFIICISFAYISFVVGFALMSKGKNMKFHTILTKSYETKWVRVR